MYIQENEERIRNSDNLLLDFSKLEVRKTATIPRVVRDFGVRYKKGEIDDVDGLARQLGRAGKDQELRNTLIENGHKTYNDLFSKKVVMKTFIDTYQEIIKKGR